MCPRVVPVWAVYSINIEKKMIMRMMMMTIPLTMTMTMAANTAVGKVSIRMDGWVGESIQGMAEPFNKL